MVGGRYYVITIIHAIPSCIKYVIILAYQICANLHYMLVPPTISLVICKGRVSFPDVDTPHYSTITSYLWPEDYCRGVLRIFPTTCKSTLDNMDNSAMSPPKLSSFG
jgi:hypothetical protein